MSISRTIGDQKAAVDLAATVKDARVVCSDGLGFEVQVGDTNFETARTDTTSRMSAVSPLLFGSDKRLLWRAPSGRRSTAKTDRAPAVMNRRSGSRCMGLCRVRLRLDRFRNPKNLTLPMESLLILPGNIQATISHIRWRILGGTVSESATCRKWARIDGSRIALALLVPFI